MITKPRFHVGTLTCTLALAVACCGCFLTPAEHSVYRPIHQYASDGNIAAVTQVLANNPHDINLPDDAQRTPLHLAADHCHVDVMRLLLGKGAKIDSRAAGGTTPLHLAAQQGCVDGIRLLLDKGAKLNARDGNGRTALNLAEEWHKDAAANLLRESDKGTR